MKKNILLFILIISICLCFFGCKEDPLDLPDTTLVPDTTKAPDEPIKPPAPDLTRVIGKTEYDLIVTDPKSKKSIIGRTATNLGELCADAYRAASGADAAFVFAGEIGAGLSRGDITLADIYGVFAAECELVTLEASGAELLLCLELAYAKLPEASGDHIHPSGITLTLDMNASGTDRIKNVQIGASPLLPDKTYTLTLCSPASKNIADIFSDNALVATEAKSNREALISYLSGGVSEAYKSLYGDGRVSVIPLGCSEPPKAANDLPQVYITTENKINRADYVACTVTVHDPTGVYGDVYDAASTVKIRGKSTSSAPKAPYNIKFSEKTELLGLGKGKKWNLLANLYDKTQLRNTLAYRFAHEIGLAYISESCFAEVYLNGEYRGLYQICEPIGVSATRVDIDLDKYEYLFEIEPYRGYSKPYTVTTPKLNILLGFEEPEEPTAEDREWLAGFFARLEDALLSGDYAKVKEYIDVDSFAKCYIVQELFKNTDYKVSSTRFYIKEDKLYEGPVWDFDLSAGNCSATYYPEYNNVTTSGNSYEGLHCVGLFNQYLFEYGEFKSLVSDLYRELQGAITALYRGSETEPSMIDALVAENAEAIDRNNALWTTKWAYNQYEHKPIDGTYEGEIKFLAEWLEKRNLWLYNYYCTAN